MTQEKLNAAIVTGGSRGIGAAIAQRLAADGFAVIVNYAGRADAAQEVVAQITASGGRALAVRADVSDPAQVTEMFETCVAQFGAPDLLVNNAGVMTLAPLVDTSDADFDRMVAINLKGVFNCLRAAGRSMQDGARIINISTTALTVNFPGYAGYCAAKAGVDAMTPIFAKELAGRNITVNGIAPGPVATALYLDGKTPEQLEHVAGLSPMGRIGQPEDIANLVAAMVRGDAGWVNGQTLRANGGMA
ncbi:3-oxoacyl-[acyl-carrier protein] reductase [Yoonia tamlensis]|uniref:3-oxoacyl-[acyl-carrier protein] reductase n=1 Tax=Yoonia tamlensis TaxID=390270 RepID=A0A1I6GH26_9RHOB|nr:SDR family oxidoreductase [Yoonia tamlensis]SFR41441.1 3-oxoacyl-[acyl-carrier protein] reductase [Yoonia tamlensis]